MSDVLLEPSTLEFEYSGREYTVEYDRQTFVDLEKVGFRLEHIPNTPLNQAELLLRFGLKKHHPNISEKIFKEINDKFFTTICPINEFIEFAIGEYNYFTMTTQSNSDEKKFKIKTR